MELTHKMVVDIAYRWVLTNAGCGVAFKELSTASSNEIPDVIGFGSWGHSVLVEVKVSRADFLSDKKKFFRQNPEQGMGSHRYYCCPDGIIKIDDLPVDWGLIYVNAKGKARLFHNQIGGSANRFAKRLPKNLIAEHGLMYSALRRLHLRNVIEENVYPWHCKEHPQGIDDWICDMSPTGVIHHRCISPKQNTLFNEINNH